MAKRRMYTAEFRVQAVRLLKQRLASGVCYQRIGEELDVNPERLRAWAVRVDESPDGLTPEQIFPGYGKARDYEPVKRARSPDRPESAEQELSRLRRENERLRMERDFLKKATAFFAKESQ